MCFAFFSTQVLSYRLNITQLIDEVSPSAPSVFENDDVATFLELESSGIDLTPSANLVYFGIFCHIFWLFLAA